MSRIQVTCTDYDGMGNQGRFPEPGNQKKETGLSFFHKKTYFIRKKNDRP